MSARRLAPLAHTAAVAAIAALTVWATALPFHDPAQGQAACIVTGSAAAALAGMWLPCPCHRKDRRR